MSPANSGTVTPLQSSNSLSQQLDNGPAGNNLTDPISESSLNGTAKYANNAAAKAAGLPVGALYLGSADPYPICMVQ